MIDREGIHDEETAILHCKGVKNLSSRGMRNKLGYSRTMQYSIAVKMNNRATDSHMNEFHNCNVEEREKQITGDTIQKF